MCRMLSPEQQDRVVALTQDFARQGRTDDLADFLDHGIPVDLQDSDGNSLLMLAAYAGQGETVAMLLERGADADLRNNRDQSSIAGALFKGEDNVVAQLVAAGADLNAGTPTARQAAQLFGRGHLLPERDV